MSLTLEALGERVRKRREALGLTQRELAARAELSLRFLAQLEAGEGNISLMRFAELARALGISAATLLAEAEGDSASGSARGPLIALVGLRGAGKSTIGKRLARQLRVPLVELDARIEQTAGLPLAQIFELHGEAYYRRLERETLRQVLVELPSAVIATGGSIVNDRETWRLLRERATTVWLRARPEDHWNRVVEQGDRRPMAQNPHAFAELRALLAAREPLYATADHAVDTSQLGLEGTVARITSLVAA
jgi:XRE family transcriptional regulator, aerobic/anaerobic benzoate catabolism transcriptional regulator